MTLEIRADTTPTLHPGMLHHLDGYDKDTQGFVETAEMAFTAAYEGIGAVHAARKGAEQNPTLNDAARLIVVADFAENHLTKILLKIDQATAVLKRSVASVNATLNAPIEGAATGGMTSEIRAHAKTLTRQDRTALLANAVNARDTKTLAALLGAPPFLSGLSDAEANLYRRQFHEAIHPDLIKRLKVMEGALSLLYKNGGLVFHEMEKAVGAGADKVAAIRSAKAKAEKTYTFAA